MADGSPASAEFERSSELLDALRRGWSRLSEQTVQEQMLSDLRGARGLRAGTPERIDGLLMTVASLADRRASSELDSAFFGRVPPTLVEAIRHEHVGAHGLAFALVETARHLREATVDDGDRDVYQRLIAVTERVTERARRRVTSIR